MKLFVMKKYINHILDWNNKRQRMQKKDLKTTKLQDIKQWKVQKLSTEKKKRNEQSISNQ